MTLKANIPYVFRMGSDNQYRVLFDGRTWKTEFLAGGVLFDHQSFESEQELKDALAFHGISLDRFAPDVDRASDAYSDAIRARQAALTEAGIAPCAKHGLTSMNPDGTCEACQNPDYPDDFKRTEG